MKRQSLPSLFSFPLAVVGLTLVPAVVLGGPAEPAYALTEVGGLTSAPPYPTAINALGDVVGQSFVPCGSGTGGVFLSCPRAFLYSADTGVTTELGLRGDGHDVYYSSANGINAAGDAVGASPESVPSASSQGSAVLYPAGGGLDFLPVDAPSVALAINAAGQIVGFEGPQPFEPTRAFLFDPVAGLTDIHSEITDAFASKATAVNAGGDVVGAFDRPLGSPYPLRRTAFMRHSSGAIDVLTPPGGLDADVEATGVNAAGEVVGTTNLLTGDSPLQAVRWSGGTAYDLGTLEPENPGVLRGAAALGINKRGEVVGFSYYYWDCPADRFCTVAPHAFVYRNGAMRDLNDLIPPDSGWVLQTATAINDAGQILAVGVTPPSPTGPRASAAFILTPVPDAMIGNLIDLLKDLGLPKGTENSLLTKLEHAQEVLAAGDIATACNLLGAFINETSAQSGKKIDAADAAELIDRAEEIRAAIGCS
jgi:probable HAF family extracellular repeat protein